MPYLRFTRDKRGYETTSLVHADRGRQGRVRQRVLYWFRSPPNVKVGRPALDEEAIRWIEQHNPDIEFDWTQILQSTPPPAPPAEDARGRQQRRGRTDRPARSERSERPERRGSPRAAPAPPPPVVEAPRPPAAEPPFEEEALEQITHPDAEAAPPVALSAVETVLGREQLIRVRARYAELQARIIERGGEPARVEELRAQADLLNPDSWVTSDEAQKGLREFEPKIRELRAALGLKRHRRSRRGGRRRRSGQPDAGGAQTTSSEPSSNVRGQDLPGSPDSPDRPERPESDEDEGGEA